MRCSTIASCSDEGGSAFSSVQMKIVQTLLDIELFHAADLAMKKCLLSNNFRRKNIPKKSQNLWHDLF